MMESPRSISRPPVSKILLVLMVIYLAWGSWFMLTSLAVRSIPPTLSVGGRVLVSATLLALILVLSRNARALTQVTRRQLLGCFLIGSLIESSSVLLTAAEKTVPSALTALIFGGVPIVVLVLRRICRERVSLAQFISCVIGLAGMVILIAPGKLSGEATTIGLLLAAASVLMWSLSVVAGDRTAMPDNLLAATTYLLLFAGLWLVPLGLILGEGSQLNLGAVSMESWLGLGLLIPLGGSGFVAYIWTLKNAGPLIASTQVYVTPLVALMLGVLVLGDPINAVGLIGAALISGSVAYIVRTETKVKATETQLSATETQRLVSKEVVAEPVA